MSSWWRSSRNELPPPARGREKKESQKNIAAAAPAVLPALLADGAGNTRRLGRGRQHARLRLAAGDLQHQLGARRLDEFLALADRHHEGARPTDHAIFVIDIEVLDIHRADIG